MQLQVARIASQFYTYGGFLTHEITESIMGSEEHGYNHHAKPPGKSQFKWQTIIVFHLLTSWWPEKEIHEVENFIQNVVKKKTIVQNGLIYRRHCYCCSLEYGRMNAEFIFHILSEEVTPASVALLNKNSLAEP